MTRARLNRIEVTGFRSFGQSSQGFDMPATVSVLWGGNSQGKTSLAEAVEFLFSGQIVRRELLASAKDEFAEALRNAHIGGQIPTRVEAEVLCSDGQVRRLSRTMTEDYRRGSAAGCVSTLTIDGNTCAETDIQDVLGVTLSHAPLVAPVLTQHTLAYIFSAPPAERSTYFRALLDTQDLEDFRLAVSKLADAIPAPKLAYIDKLASFEAIDALKEPCGKLRKAKSEADVEKHLIACLGAILGQLGMTASGVLADDAEAFDKEHQSRRSQSFPLSLFRRGQSVPLPPLSDENRDKIDAFVFERGRVEEEAKRLTALFVAALEIHDHTEESGQDCPLCGTKDALSPERMNFIREQAAASSAYREASEEFSRIVRAIEAQTTASIDSGRALLPEFLLKTVQERRNLGFSIQRVRDLVADEQLVEPWLKAVGELLLAATRRVRLFQKVANACAAGIETPDEWNGRDELVELFKQVQEASVEVERLVPIYQDAAKAVYDPLKIAVDQSTATDGWEGLVECAKHPSALFTALQIANAHAAKIKAVQSAVDEIDKGNGKVADGKFAELSDDVRLWWDRLRPDEATFFESVQRRSSKARRTVDLRVGLSAKEDRSDVKFRDAVAVLSQSQLHCLGLSLFLARAAKEGVGFVVLDDPVLTSDDDYRPNFASSVIEGLLDAGIQVIVATQDHGTWKDIGHRWSHRDASLLQLVRNDPVEGTEVRNQSDDLATMIAKAQPYTKSQDPIQRKEGASLVRLAIERFGKMILVKSRKANGDNLASITDYDGQNFGNYSGQVQLLLTADPSHPGKITAAHNYVTPAAHDDTPPSAGQLKMAYGDLKALKRVYLDS